MQRDSAGFLSTTYTYGNQRINTESINNLSGIYTYDGRGSVSSVIGGWGDFRATYWYDGLGNVKSQIHGYGVFGSGKRYFGYNAEQYNPVTGNQNLRARQINIRRQRFLTEDTYLGDKTDTLSINRYIYGNDNPLKFIDPSGNTGFEPYAIEMLDQYSPVIEEWLDETWMWIASGFAALSIWSAVNESNTKNNESRIKSKVNKAESLSDSGTCGGSSNNNNSSQKETNNDDLSTNSKRHTPDQEALGKLAKEAINRGKNSEPISREEAEIFDKWAEEYNVPQHHQTGEGDPEHWKGGDGQDHTHWYKHHIPYKD